MTCFIVKMFSTLCHKMTAFTVILQYIKAAMINLLRQEELKRDVSFSEMQQCKRMQKHIINFSNLNAMAEICIKKL